MRKTRALLAVVALTLVAPALRADTTSGRKFEWTTQSTEAKTLLAELQRRIENFQIGPENLDLAKKLVAADPNFAMGQYYLSAVAPGPDAQKEYEKARVLAKTASDGERRFIEALYYARVNQGVDFKKCIEPLEALAKDYPNERLIQVILGQLYSGTNEGSKAVGAFEKAKAIGPKSARVEAFLAGDDLLKGHYAKARATYQEVEKDLPKGSVPFAIRFGVTFSHLYEGNVDAALESLRTYLAEYKGNKLDQAFPEVFIWNAMARINLENGRLDEAMKDYEEGYKSVPKSNLPDDQKQVWLGRLRHGKARVLARMGKQQEAWAEAENVKHMIETGGEEAKQYWPAYHYLAGYVKLQAGDYAEAIDHLKQAEPANPFHTLLLARAYEKAGQKDEAKKQYQKIVNSEWVGIERPLAYPEAKKRLESL